MFIIDESEKEYRFGDSGPKYLMKGPRSNFALVQFQAGQDFKAHYHNIMEENFFFYSNFSQNSSASILGSQRFWSPPLPSRNWQAAA